MPNKPLHITIIGAGLGGLCLAQGLKQRGIAFEVFERDAAPSSRLQGYRIRIDQQGQQALRACLSPARYALFEQTCALPVHGVNVVDSQLQPVRNKWVDAWQRSAEAGAAQEETEDLNVNRQTLREILLGGIREQVHFGKTFSHYRECADGRVASHFSDGSICVSDVLVGADGANSLLRELRLPSVPPQDSGSVCLYGKTPLTPEVLAQISPLLPAKTSIVFGDRLAVIIDSMRFARWPHVADTPLSAVDDYQYWAIIGPQAQLGMDEASLVGKQTPLLAQLDQLSRSWHKGLRALLLASDPASLARLPIRSAVPLAAWPSNAITLLGDAIHVMSPAGGLGANTALRDAALLAEQLEAAATGRIAMREAIAAYEAAMREYSALAIAASRRGAEMLFGVD